MAGPTPAKKRSLYEILGVERDANAIDIGMAYKQRLAEMNRAANPDPNELGLVREAYHILCQPKEREAYDASLVTREEKAAAAAQETDLVLEPDEPEAKKPPWLWIGAGAVLVASLLFMVMRQTTGPAPAATPAPVAAAVEAPKPAPPPPPPKQLSTQEVFGVGAPGVARMSGYEISGRAVPIGSGVLVAPDAIVSTCHALPPSGQVVARLGAEEVPATLAVTDEDLDLCRFSIVKVSASPAPVAADEPKVGDKVIAIAQHAGGKELSAVEGTVKSYKTVGGVRLIEISMPVSPTANGGALFDTYGRLVGILTSRQRTAGPAFSAVPASALGQMRTRGKPAPAQ